MFGTVSAVYEAVHTKDHTGRAVHSASDRAAACSARPQAQAAALTVTPINGQQCKSNRKLKVSRKLELEG